MKHLVYINVTRREILMHLNSNRVREMDIIAVKD